MATPLTDQEARDLRYAERVRQRWDPWDSLPTIIRDGENLRNRAPNGGGLGRTSAAKTLEKLKQEGLEELPRATRKSTDVVYFIQPKSGGPVKIGHTTQRSLSSRLHQLQISNPEELVVRELLDGGAWLEAALHALFTKHRLRGEWFEPTEQMRQLFGVA